jgi:hypothetical protein
MAITYIQGAELPDIEVTWNDSDGNAIDFTSGWTFTLRIGQTGQAASLEKTTGITGSSGVGGTPNVVISWSSTELETLAVNSYKMQLIARNTSSGKDRKLSDDLVIEAQVLPPA